MSYLENWCYYGDCAGAEWQMLLTLVAVFSLAGWLIWQMIKLREH